MFLCFLHFLNIYDGKRPGNSMQSTRLLVKIHNKLQLLSCSSTQRVHCNSIWSRRWKVECTMRRSLCLKSQTFFHPFKTHVIRERCFTSLTDRYDILLIPFCLSVCSLFCFSLAAHLPSFLHIHQCCLSACLYFILTFPTQVQTLSCLSLFV